METHRYLPIKTVLDLSFRIRLATKADLRTLFKIDQACFPPTIAYPYSYFRDLWNVQAYFVVAEHLSSKQIAGFVVGYQQYLDAGTVITLDILPQFRRQGLGRELMMHILDYFLTLHLDTALLQVQPSNHAARTMYENMGFGYFDRIPNYYGKGLDAFLMIKTLEAPSQEE
jgi:[ribosomal protein S18]-alanine N-acetyltransferase